MDCKSSPPPPPPKYTECNKWKYLNSVIFRTNENNDIIYRGDGGSDGGGCGDSDNGGGNDGVGGSCDLYIFRCRRFLIVFFLVIRKLHWLYFYICGSMCLNPCVGQLSSQAQNVIEHRYGNGESN